MAAARAAVSLAEPLAMAPGWAKRRRGRSWSANLVVVAIKKVMMMRKVAEIFIFKGVVVIVLLAGTIRKGKKDLFGRTRSNPVFCSVTPSIGGTWDVVRNLMKLFGEGVYFADFVCLPPFMAFMVGSAFRCYIWAKFRRFNVYFRYNDKFFVPIFPV